MDPPAKSSVAHWLDGLRDGDSLAAQALWGRYFSQLVTVANSRLAGIAGDVSGEDIALSTLKSVMVGVREGRYPDLSDSENLWPLLVTITARKSISQQRRQLAKKRSRNRECQIEDIQTLIGQSPSTEFAHEVADQLETLVRALGDPSLQTVVARKLAGFSHEEIAKEVGCTDRTVKRKLRLVRQEWLAQSALEADP